MSLDKGKQRFLIIETSKQFGSVKKLAIELKIPYSTLKKYCQEEFLLPENLFVKLFFLSGFDKNFSNITYLPKYWGASLGGKKGIKTLQKRYAGKLSMWRKKGLKKFQYTNLKSIKIPELDETLAEFIGAYIGDGTLTKYFIRISGDYRYDLPYFDYLNVLVSKIFGVNSCVYKSKIYNTCNFTILSKNICSFLSKEFGLKFGDKLRNNTLIPNKILRNRKLAFACLRGLVDTDGCVSRRGRNGEELSISFFSANPKLVNQVKKLSDGEGFFSYVSKNKTEIGTNSKKKALLYFKKIGSSNLRHIVRFNEFLVGNKVYQKDVGTYYQKDLYRDINLPFKLTAP